MRIMNWLLSSDQEERELMKKVTGVNAGPCGGGLMQMASCWSRCNEGSDQVLRVKDGSLTIAGFI